MFSLVYSDPGFGVRVVEALDPELIPQKAYSGLFGVVQQYVRSEGSVPGKVIIRQLLQQQYHSGTMSSEDRDKALRYLKKSLGTDPVSREDAKIVLTSAILDTEVLAALDESYRLYKDRKYDDVFVRMDEAQQRTRLLDLGSVGWSLSGGLDEYLQQISDGLANVDRIPIGVSALDIGIKGGLGRGALGCILGAEKDGKSMALVHIGASDFLAGYYVVYITLELPQLDVQNRFAANVTGIPINRLEKGGAITAGIVGEALERIIKKSGGDFVVKAFPGGTATVRDVEAYLKDIRRLWGFAPDVVIVDYADELISSQKVRNVDSSTTYLTMGKIYTDLRAMGAPSSQSSGTRGGFDCAVWTASQVQRSAIGKQVLEFRDVADSILKAAKVDLMVGLCRDEEEREADLVRLYVAACRYAPFPQEVGPYQRDYTHGRLVKFDSTVRRFTEETCQRRKSERSLSRSSPHLWLPRPNLTRSLFLQMRKRSRKNNHNSVITTPRTEGAVGPATRWLHVPNGTS